MTEERIRELAGKFADEMGITGWRKESLIEIVIDLMIELDLYRF